MAIELGEQTSMTLGPVLVIETLDVAPYHDADEPGEAENENEKRTAVHDCAPSERSVDNMVGVEGVCMAARVVRRCFDEQLARSLQMQLPGIAGAFPYPSRWG
jgi:hypothetical protein